MDFYPLMGLLMQRCAILGMRTLSLPIKDTYCFSDLCRPQVAPVAVSAARPENTVSHLHDACCTYMSITSSPRSLFLADQLEADCHSQANGGAGTTD